jgi:membrane protein implicated in regulation of membrane protease activity
MRSLIVGFVIAIVITVAAPVFTGWLLLMHLAIGVELAGSFVLSFALTVATFITALIVATFIAYSYDGCIRLAEAVRETNKQIHEYDAKLHEMLNIDVNGIYQESSHDDYHV